MPLRFVSRVARAMFGIFCAFLRPRAFVCSRERIAINDDDDNFFLLSLLLHTQETALIVYLKRDVDYLASKIEGDSNRYR
jgi:hypothetical protein